MIQTAPRIIKTSDTGSEARIVSRRVRTDESGKIFLSFMDKDLNNVEDKSVFSRELNRSKVDDNKPRDEENDRKVDTSKLEDVVEGMGLSYFFVLQEEGNRQEAFSSEKDLTDGLSLDLKEVSQLLAGLGFSSEDIYSFQIQLTNEGKIDWKTLLDFLSSHQPIHENATVKGCDLSKILSGISLSSDSLHFSLDPDKEFSFEEVKSIFERLFQFSQELKQSISNSKLNNMPESILSSEISSFQGLGKEDQFEIYQRNLQDAFVKSGMVNKLRDVDITSLTGNAIASGSTEFAKDNEDKPWGLSQFIASEHDGMESFAVKSRSFLEDFSGSGGSGSTHDFSFTQQAGNGLLNSGDLQLPVTDSFQNFGQIMSQVQVQSNSNNYSVVIISQIAERIGQMRQENQNRIILQLEPPELGRVTVRLSAKDHKISTAITTENEEVKDLLQKNSEILKRYFEEQGLLLEEFSVEYENDGNSSYAYQRDYKGFSQNEDAAPLPFFPEKMFEPLEASRNSGREDVKHLIHFYI